MVKLCGKICKFGYSRVLTEMATELAVARKAAEIYSIIRNFYDGYNSNVLSNNPKNYYNIRL